MPSMGLRLLNTDVTTENIAVLHLAVMKPYVWWEADIK